MAASDIYEGRLVTDGDGNLLADEGDRAGDPVAYHDGSYIFLQEGEESHNDRHHATFVAVGRTIDPSEAGQAHHAGVLEDDAHFDANEENRTKLKFLPNREAKTASGHTAAYTKGGK